MIQRNGLRVKSESTLKPLLVDPRAAARMLGIGQTKLRELTRSGAIPSVVIGERMRRYRMSELEHWIEQGCPETPKGVRAERAI